MKKLKAFGHIISQLKELNPEATKLIAQMFEEVTPAETRTESELHRVFAHPDYQYRVTEGQRKNWDDSDKPPKGEGWELNIDAGIDGWERFDFTEETYWRRKRKR
jgi:hypothetical protein